MEYIILSVIVVIGICCGIAISRLVRDIAQKKEEYAYWTNAVETITAEHSQIQNRIKDEYKCLDDIHHKVDFASDTLKDLHKQYDVAKDHLDDIKRISQENEEKLNQEYTRAAQEYQDRLNEYKAKCDIEEAAVNKELQSLKATYHTVIEQWRQREQEKHADDGHKLIITEQDKHDISLLQNIRNQFSNPRVISKLIWQTYFQPLVKQKFIMILGKSGVCGIYKITNTITNKCYIGQAVDMYKRWCDHCKYGCGIDTPQNNRLYTAMQQDGIENFTFELLEECSREELNKKEAFYIDLYKSNEFGYNQTAGNN